MNLLSDYPRLILNPLKRINSNFFYTKTHHDFCCKEIEQIFIVTRYKNSNKPKLILKTTKLNSSLSRKLMKKQFFNSKLVIWDNFILKITLQILRNGVLMVEYSSVQNYINRLLLIIRIFLTNNHSGKTLIFLPSYYDHLFCFDLLRVLFRSFKKWLLIDPKNIALLEAKEHQINFNKKSSKCNTSLAIKNEHNKYSNKNLQIHKIAEMRNFLYDTKKNMWDTVRILINDSLKILAFKGRFLFKISRLIFQNLANFRTIIIFEPDLFILLELIVHLICKKTPTQLYNIIIINFGGFRSKPDLVLSNSILNLLNKRLMKQKYFTFFSVFRKNFAYVLKNKNYDNFSTDKTKTLNFYKHNYCFSNIIEIQHKTTAESFSKEIINNGLLLFLSLLSQYIILRLLGYKSSDINLVVRQKVKGLRSKQTFNNIIQNNTVLKKPIIRNNFSLFIGKKSLFIIMDKGMLPKNNLSLIPKIYYILSLHAQIVILNDNCNKSMKSHKLVTNKDRLIKLNNKNKKFIKKISSMRFLLQTAFVTYSMTNSIILNHLLFCYIYNCVI